MVVTMDQQNRLDTLHVPDPPFKLHLSEVSRSLSLSGSEGLRSGAGVD